MAEVTDVADGKAQSSTVGDQKHKKKKKKTKKQAKAEEPAAMTNRGAAQALFVAAATTALVAFSFHVSRPRSSSPSNILSSHLVLISLQHFVTCISFFSLSTKITLSVLNLLTLFLN
jgi:hypothetical protein